MKRILLTLLVAALLSACATPMGYGPFEVKYLYGGCDTVFADRVEFWAGHLYFSDIVDGKFIEVGVINADHVLAYRSLDPKGYKPGMAN